MEQGSIIILTVCRRDYLCNKCDYPCKLIVLKTKKKRLSVRDVSDQRVERRILTTANTVVKRKR